MEIQIHAIDADDDEGPSSSRGKRTRLRATALTVTGYTHELTIRAEMSEQIGSGRRGGNPKTIDRRLVLSLSKQDVLDIVDEAIKARLIVAPGSEEVSAAFTSLEAAAVRMGVKK